MLTSNENGQLKIGSSWTSLALTLSSLIRQ